MGGRRALSLACRHHVFEIIISAVYSCALNDKSQSPNIGLFVTFKEGWKNIDARKIEFGIEHEKVQAMMNEWEINEIIDIINEQHNAQQSNDRKDYTEFLDLSLIFLGARAYQNQKIIKIRPPGALHRARFMSRVIYCLKMFAFRSQLNLCDNEIDGLINFNHFVVTVYLKNWFTCVLASQAPVNDLDLIGDLHSYREKNQAISEAALKKITDHLWYLGDINGCIIIVRLVKIHIFYTAEILAIIVIHIIPDILILAVILNVWIFFIHRCGNHGYVVQIIFNVTCDTIKISTLIHS